MIAFLFVAFAIGWVPQNILPLAISFGIFSVLVRSTRFIFHLDSSTLTLVSIVVCTLELFDDYVGACPSADAIHFLLAFYFFLNDVVDIKSLAVKRKRYAVGRGRANLACFYDEWR